MSNLLTDALFPPRCCGCDSPAEKGSPVCRECRNKILYPADPKTRCEICFLHRKDCVCSAHLFYEKLAVPFYYEGSVRKTVQKMKFRGRRDLIKQYARMIKLSLEQREMLDETDIITFIPMGKFSQFKRGYNQAELLAEALSEITGKPCIKLLEKTFSSATQHSLGKTERSGNLLGVYEPVRQNTDKIINKTILITDDIVTTGSTVNEAAKTLLIFGAEAVNVCACAVTKKKKLNKNLIEFM